MSICAGYFVDNEGSRSPLADHLFRSPNRRLDLCALGVAGGFLPGPAARLSDALEVTVALRWPCRQIWLAQRVKELSNGAQSPMTLLPFKEFTNWTVYQVATSAK